MSAADIERMADALGDMRLPPSDLRAFLRVVYTTAGVPDEKIETFVPIVLRSAVRAVLAAAREPTQDMVDAMVAAYTDPRDIWKAGIDKALEGEVS